MAFVFSFLIGGAVCLIGQVCTEIKIPPPIPTIGIIVLGGILTPFGVMDALARAGAGGTYAFASGLGNGAFVTGGLFAQGTAQPIVMFIILLLILFGIGAACGILYHGMYPDKVRIPPEMPGEKASR
jgi:hypothetical protein